MAKKNHLDPEFIFLLYINGLYIAYVTRNIECLAYYSTIEEKMSESILKEEIPWH